MNLLPFGCLNEYVHKSLVLNLFGKNITLFLFKQKLRYKFDTLFIYFNVEKCILNLVFNTEEIQ
jgi:hypothetical protein